MKREDVCLELETENGCVIRATFSARDPAILDPDEFQKFVFQLSCRSVRLTEEQWRGLGRVMAEYLEGLSDSASADVATVGLVAKLNQSVDTLDLSVRVANCLQNAGIRYIGELVQKTEEKMWRIRDFGRKRLVEVRSELAKSGLSLGMGDNPTVKSWQPPAE